jgi:hypothetical protein
MDDRELWRRLTESKHTHDLGRELKSQLPNLQKRHNLHARLSASILGLYKSKKQKVVLKGIELLLPAYRALPIAIRHQIRGKLSWLINRILKTS